jgi:CRISPR system Cascade subunit CasB
MPPERKAFDYKEAVFSLSQQMRFELDTGAMARLRRMDVDGAGEPDYWQLAAQCGFLDENHDRWRRIVNLMALLCGKGEAGQRGALHDSRRGLGAALCDGGDPNWSPGPAGDGRPVLSEPRFARFLELSSADRHAALERLMRWLVAHRNRDSGVNCAEIAELILFPDPVRTLRRIARDYYRRLDSQSTKTETPEEAA